MLPCSAALVCVLVSKTHVVTRAPSLAQRSKLPSCKLNVYEHDVRVPLLVRGPGLVPGTFISALAGNTDLAPTILDLAGGPGAVNPIMDGKSLAGLLTSSGEAHWTRDTFLIEYNSLGEVLRGAPG